MSKPTTPDTSVQISDLKERQARLYATMSEMEGPPLPLMVSSMERLAGLLEKAEPILEATLPQEQDEASIPVPH